ncbi:MAG: DUF433 domain-containing protein [Stellaceae bacterium]
MSQSVFSSEPEIMGGAPVLRHARPVRTLLDYLEAGDSNDDFLLPAVTREQVVTFRVQAKDRLVATFAMGNTWPRKWRFSSLRLLFLRRGPGRSR